MQELLKPKETWIEKELGEVAYCLDTLRVPLNDSQRATMKGDFPYCGANGILDYINDYRIYDTVILIAEDGGYFDQYLTRPIAYRMSGKFWVNNHAHILKSKPGYDQDFLFYSLVHKNITSAISSGTRAKLNRSALNKITLNLPDELSEQKFISNVLNDIDNEIHTLEEETIKLQLIKKGMMQQLLTGRIRLV